MAESTVHPLTIRLFGTFQVLCAGSPLPALRSQKGKWLFALLTLRHGREVQRAWLADRLWPDNDKAQRSLNTSLFDLRKALGAEAVRLPAGSRTLCLDLSDADVDVIAFDAAIARGDLDSLREAVSLYTGPLLEDCSEPCVAQEREERANAYVTALETLATRALADGDRDHAIACLQKAVAVKLIQEKTHRWLMQVLADAGDYAAATQVYQDLSRRLQKEFSCSPEDATTALYQHIRQRGHRRATTAVPPPVTPTVASASPINIPRPLTALLGRDQELQSISAQVLSARFVTLTGPGGVGKTRLATEAALEIAADFAHGACLVSLDALTDSRLIPQQVAKALGVDGRQGRTWTEMLQDYLRGRQLLLILDNCEHLIDACANLARALLGACPGLHLLATSRERFGLTGEVVQTVPPLAVPDTNTPSDLQQCLNYPAVRLFCERAAAVRADFAPAGNDIANVVQICRRLDGLPLAIELAAALVESLSVQDIAARINDDRFDLLQLGDKTAPKRHQALTAMLDWSYDRLTAPEKNLLCRLCVFSGGWTLEAEEALDLTLQGKQSETRKLLPLLISKSLIFAKRDKTEMRYGMLETIREYGRERLNDSTAWEQLRQAHCEYYAAFAEAAESQLLGPDQITWLEKLELEDDNLRSALGWATGGSGNPVMALRLGGALGRFWSTRGYYEEGVSWLNRILQMPGETLSALRPKCTKHLGNLYYLQGKNAEARPCFERCLAFAQQSRDRYEQATALASLANVYLNENEHEKARELLVESLGLFEEIDDVRGRALTLSNLAIVAYRSENDSIGARELHLKGLALFRQLGAMHDVAQECNNLVYTLFKLGETESIPVYLEESLTLCEALESPRLLVNCLSNYRVMAILKGEMQRAGIMIGAELALREKIQMPMRAQAVMDCHKAEGVIRTALGPTGLEACIQQGRAMTKNEVVDYIKNYRW